MRSDTQFHRAWWLPGPHPQTVWGPLARGRRLIAVRREVIETPDGDDLVLDHLEGAEASPRVLILHGLEGSSHSVYVQGLFRELSRRGWRGTAMNFRSCARDPRNLSRVLPNRRPRLYHSGETGDLETVVGALTRREPAVPLVAVGVSIGGNVLLKWLGETPTQTAVTAAVAVSTPYDLAESARHLESAAGRLYARRFLVTMRRKARDTALRFPEAAARIDLPRALAARTFCEFDDAATAPLHGFAGASDYYRKASSLFFLPAIATPTLCLSAEDDPFLPRAALERARAAAALPVDFAVTPNGGHIGWVGGPWPWRPRYWAETFLLDWLDRRLD